MRNPIPSRSAAARAVLTGSVVLALVTPFAATSLAASAATTSSVSTAVSAPASRLDNVRLETPMTVLDSVAVASNGTARADLSALPDNVAAVDLVVEGRWAWKATKISVAAGDMTAAAKASPVLTTPVQNLGSAQTSITLDGKRYLTVHSSAASVRVTVKVLGYTYLGFPADSAVQAPAPEPAPAPAPAPAEPQLPTESTVGLPAGTPLTVYKGNMTIWEPNTVIDGMDIQGIVKVRADNVTIKNSIIRGAATPAKAITHFVWNTEGNKNLVIKDTTIASQAPSPYDSAVLGYNFTLERVNIHTVVDQVTIIGDNVTIKDTMLHGNKWYANDPNHNGGPSHDDNIQIQAGKNITIVNSILKGTYNAAIQITQARGKVGNLTVEDSYLDNGGCTVNIAQMNNGPLEGVVFRDNVFGNGQRIDGCGIIRPVTTTIVSDNNVFADGRAFVLKRG